MGSYDTITVHRRGPAEIITLHRPESMNAWSGQMAAELCAALDASGDDEDVRAVGLTGAGRAFCSGADLNDVRGDGPVPQLEPLLRDLYNPVIARVRSLPKPVVAAVNGPAAGVGVSLALAADLVIAAESAYFLLAFTNIGLAPDGGASAFVAARVGFTRAAEMALLGERVGAVQAASWGLINRAVPDAELDDTVNALLDRLAAGATAAYAGTKRELNAWMFDRLDEHLDLEARIQGGLGASDDFREGVAAFHERRATTFRGR